MVQSVLSFVGLSFGILVTAPRLRGVTWASEFADSKRVDHETSLASFATARHRGTRFFGELS